MEPNALSFMTIRHIYISPDHVFKDHYGREPGETPMEEVKSAECVEGRGIRGDRYFDFKESYKGQVTFFAHEVYLDLLEQFQGSVCLPDVFRRNVITEGIDLNTLIGEEFEVQGIRFVGTEESKPCHWMNTAFGPGAEEALRGKGGLRARVITTGTLRAE